MTRALRPAVPTGAADPVPQTGAPGPAPAPEWVPTRALGRAVLLTGLLLILGVLLGRIDLVVLAVPFGLGTAYALRQRPSVAPGVQVDADDTHLVEGGPVAGTVGVDNPGVVDFDLVIVRTLVSPWLRIDRAGQATGPAPAPNGGQATGAGSTAGADEGLPAGGLDRPFVLTTPAGSGSDLLLRGEALRWGRHPIGPAGVRAVACDGLVACRPVVSGARTVRVYPRTEPFEADEAMPRAAGLVGGHRSRRPGEGGELAGVRVFGPGDRLRRIDWRVSLRARQLHVAATLSDRDAEVVLLLDVLAEAGRSGGIAGTASVLDTTVRAAAAIGEHYLHRGDRVSMLEYGPSARRLRPATGRRQYLTLLEWLLDVRVEQSEYQPYDQVFGPHLLSSNALLVVLTPLVDPRSAEMLARLARSGRFVVAVDTLPAGVGPPLRSPWTQVAYGLWRLERENTIGQLRQHGVPVVAWAGAGSLDLVLRDVARMAAAPRVGMR
ncbi:DUF58 domain-containing protein [Micromonospora echinofusca]|uniref:DUF58 domain-containing protein n=1 Tax=Micromonospora echinofusca TaxID=47858 RepID=A0ABS3VWA5_MICEH|nr:DUF58 domain-containing protein [Micromonospora echinofusca]MBO4208708.1 DUF58 domain-containing protein [Micromonospora echinofusca]